MSKIKTIIGIILAITFSLIIFNTKQIKKTENAAKMMELIWLSFAFFCFLFVAFWFLITDLIEDKYKKTEREVKITETIYRDRERDRESAKKTTARISEDPQKESGNDPNNDSKKKRREVSTTQIVQTRLRKILSTSKKDLNDE